MRRNPVRSQTSSVLKSPRDFWRFDHSFLFSKFEPHQKVVSFRFPFCVSFCFLLVSAYLEKPPMGEGRVCGGKRLAARRSARSASRAGCRPAAVARTRWKRGPPWARPTKSGVASSFFRGCNKNGEVLFFWFPPKNRLKYGNPPFSNVVP